MVQHPHQGGEVTDWTPDRVIPHALKMVPAAILLDAQRYRTRAGFSSPIHLITCKKVRKNSPIITIVCSHRRTVCKNDSHVINACLSSLAVKISFGLICYRTFQSKHFSQQNLLNKVRLRRERCANLSACLL